MADKRTEAIRRDLRTSAGEQTADGYCEYCGEKEERRASKLLVAKVPARQLEIKWSNRLSCN